MQRSVSELLEKRMGRLLRDWAIVRFKFWMLVSGVRVMKPLWHDGYRSRLKQRYLKTSVERGPYCIDKKFYLASKSHKRGGAIKAEKITEFTSDSWKHKQTTLLQSLRLRSQHVDYCVYEAVFRCLSNRISFKDVWTESIIQSTGVHCFNSARVEE